MLEICMSFSWKNEFMIITGTTTGLGRALAVKAGKLQATVILISRNEEMLADVCQKINRSGGNAFYFCFDLQNVCQIPKLYRSIVQKVKKPPTILINNVGYQVAGFVQNTPVEVFERNYRVNTLAPIALIQCVLPDMLRNKKGIIGNVMSSVMYHAFPGVSSYCASKNALGAIHESLKAELIGTPIKTLYISPGGFQSNYWKNTEVGNRVPGFTYPTGENSRDPSIVADKICSAIEKGAEKFDLSSYKDKIGYHLKYWAPSILEKVIVYKNRKLLSKRPYI